MGVTAEPIVLNRPSSPIESIPRLVIAVVDANEGRKEGREVAREPTDEIEHGRQRRRSHGTADAERIRENV